jgi:hypothetical protein
MPPRAPRFVADGKFGDVIEVLTERGWVLSTAKDPTLSLRWRNLKETPFSRIRPDTYVNHLEGSHNLSNKGKISRVLATADQGRGLACYPRCHALATTLSQSATAPAAGAGRSAVVAGNEASLVSSLDAMLRDVVTQFVIAALLWLEAKAAECGGKLAVGNMPLLAVCVGVAERWAEQLEEVERRPWQQQQPRDGDDETIVPTDLKGESGGNNSQSSSTSSSSSSPRPSSSPLLQTKKKTRVPSREVLAIGGAAWQALKVALKGKGGGAHDASGEKEEGAVDSLIEALGVTVTSAADGEDAGAAAETTATATNNNKALQLTQKAALKAVSTVLHKLKLFDVQHALLLGSSNHSDGGGKQQQQQQQQQQAASSGSSGRGSSGGGVWIVKPSGASCGQGILCLRSLPSIALAVAELDFRAVVQK